MVVEINLRRMVVSSHCPSIFYRLLGGVSGSFPGGVVLLPVKWCSEGKIWECVQEFLNSISCTVGYFNITHLLVGLLVGADI